MNEKDFNLKLDLEIEKALGKIKSIIRERTEDLEINRICREATISKPEWPYPKDPYVFVGGNQTVNVLQCLLHHPGAIPISKLRCCACNQQFRDGEIMMPKIDVVEPRFYGGRQLAIQILHHKCPELPTDTKELKIKISNAAIADARAYSKSRESLLDYVEKEISQQLQELIDK